MPLRLSTVLIRVASFVVAALLSYFAAVAVVAVVENRSVITVQEALIDDDQSWATVLGDGLQVIIEGRAPSEAARFRSISIAGSIVDASARALVLGVFRNVDPSGAAVAGRVRSQTRP